MAKVVEKYPICEKCKQERKPIKLAGRMKRTCDCGVFEVDGKQIISY